LGVRLAFPGDSRGPTANNTLRPKIAARNDHGLGKWNLLVWFHAHPPSRPLGPPRGAT
jgi:hypothetical protein